MKDRRKQFFHLRDSIESARQILELITKEELDKKEIVTAFKNGLSGSKLVIKFKLVKKLRKPKGSAKRAILVALKGYDGNTQGLGEAFDGLIPRQEYIKIAEEHIQKSHTDVGFSNLKRKVGIHAQTSDERAAHIKAAMIARGLTPPKHIKFFSKEEIAVIEGCIGKPEYKERQADSPTKIAKYLNTIFPGRNASMNSVFAVMTQLKKKHKNAA